ncbi:MAG TPA: MoxR family ATPase [Actinomycetales bacterium]|nr:MoxR family ATPase [Actinomycetales bacterium]
MTEDEQAPAATELDVPTVSALCHEVLDEVERAVVGKRVPLTLVLAAVLSGGHVLIEDMPGLGKTLAARSLARALGLTFSRAQFTPDMLPADLTGSFVYDQRGGEFVLRKGPLFTGLLLADEINRTPPKTQSALLEAMQEHQVTVEGATFVLPEPFHVLATSNPVEYEGTFPLPEAQLDRFLLKISFGYPSADEEWEVVARRIERQQEDVPLRAVTDAAGVLAMRRTVETVTVDASLGRYCVALVAATRRHQHVLVGASPRGSLALVTAARALAVIAGRDYVTPEDVKAVAQPALAHRLTIRPELWMTDVTATGVVAQVLSQVPTPAAVETETAVTR